MEAPLLQDRHGRNFESMRVSVTDRCNFRCRYCMPAEGMEWFPRSEILSFEEIARVVGVAAEMGIRRLRVTGGEPLVRSDLPELVAMLLAVPGIEEVALTTNAALLPPMAAELRRAGIDRVNVSLDSLDRETFRRLCRRDALEATLAGLEAAIETFPRVKVNTVLVRGVNEVEAVDFADLARERGLWVRFIEYMPLDAGSDWGPEQVVPGAETKARIEEVHPLLPQVPPRPAQPSRDWAFGDGAGGGVGFINPVTEPFCGDCDRMRLTADGKLYNCMFDRDSIDLRPVLRGDGGTGGVREGVIGALRASARAKGPGGLLELREAGYYKDMRNMSRLGG